MTQERAAELIAEREQLGATTASLAAEIEERKAERKVVAEEKDDAPPASDLRPAERAGRPGAPLWQLVRFADELPVRAAAGIEGALYGAGILTAWIHPDPALTYGAVAGAEADGFLVAAPTDAWPAGRTLSDVLVPEEQDMVPAALVQAVLRSILVTDEVGHDGGPEKTRAAGGPVVTLGAQYSQGVQVGARPKLTPEFIGATNRASRRRARLAEIDAQVAELERLRAGVAARRQAVVDLLDDLGARAARAAQDRADHRGAEQGHGLRGPACRGAEAARSGAGNPGRRDRRTRRMHASAAQHGRRPRPAGQCRGRERGRARRRRIRPGGAGAGQDSRGHGPAG